MMVSPTPMSTNRTSCFYSCRWGFCHPNSGTVNYFRKQKIPFFDNMAKDVLLQFSMYPLDKGESLSKYVARSLKIIDTSGVSYKLGPMSTTLEGDYDEVMGVMKQCFDRMKEDCNRIGVYMKIDYRKDHEGRIEGKVKSVEEKVGKGLRT